MTNAPKQHGFTLIEIMVVIAIISLLAVVVAAGISDGPKRARDARRKGDMRSIKVALEAYFSDNQSYPVITTLSPASDLEPILSPRYIPEVPSDPSTLQYTYIGTGCTPTPPKCSGFELTATLENVADNEQVQPPTDPPTYKITSTQ